jgi:quercetin dioxygenase-like cupin family protein
MMIAALVLATSIAVAPPLVPGGCTAPAADHQDEAGCYLLAEMSIANAPSELYWHIVEFSALGDAQREAQRHQWSRTVSAHGKVWLLAMVPRTEQVSGGTPTAVVGPMAVPPGGAASVRFLTSNFSPGMRTRVHAHPGSEGFYVIDGEQCVETPTVRHRIKAGRSYIMTGGLHMQASAKGRKSLVALVLKSDLPWSVPQSGWVPSHFCDR